MIAAQVGLAKRPLPDASLNWIRRSNCSDHGTRLGGLPSEAGAANSQQAPKKRPRRRAPARV